MMAGNSWDREADVLVVGSGAAGHCAAIRAKSNGADVLMVEKGQQAGGTTQRSGGGFWIPNNRLMREKGMTDSKEDAVRYMARYSYPQLYDPDAPNLGLPKHAYDMISTYYDTASKTVDFLVDVGALRVTFALGTNGQPAPDYQDGLPENKGARGRCIFAASETGEVVYGAGLINQLKAWTDSHGIPLLLDHRASKILTEDGRVVGIEATTGEGRTVRLGARRGVVFASGGFTHNPELMLNFQRPQFGGCAVSTNEGDFVYLGQEIGAKLGNMQNAWHAQVVAEIGLQKGNPVDVFYMIGDSMLEVNKYGVRVMDEKRNYNDRTMVHFEWDPNKAEWKNMLLFAVFDQRVADLWEGYGPSMLYPFAKSAWNLKGDTWEELTKAIEGKLAQLAPHTGGFALDPSFTENLKKTVARFNEFARKGVDEDFQRGQFAYDRDWPNLPPMKQGVTWPSPDQPNPTMYPLSDRGPYYAIVLGAGTLDTNGGPVIDHQARVLDTRGRPIPGLFGAGNCVASAAANAYWGGGATIGNALTFGYIAGGNASGEKAEEVPRPAMAGRTFWGP